MPFIVVNETINDGQGNLHHKNYAIDRSGNVSQSYDTFTQVERDGSATEPVTDSPSPTDQSATDNGPANTDAINTVGTLPIDQSLIGTGITDVLSSEVGNSSIYGGDGSDSLYGGDGNNQLNGESGDDFLQGGAGNDTYVFARGGGHDSIDNYDPTAGRVDRLVLDGLNATDVAIGRAEASDDLILTIKDTGESVSVSNFFSDVGYQINQISFADGTVLDAAAIVAQELSNAAAAAQAATEAQTAADALAAAQADAQATADAEAASIEAAANATAQAAADAQTEVDQAAADAQAATVASNASLTESGDGASTVEDATAATANSALSLLEDAEHLWFQHVDNDLVVSVIGTDDHLTFSGWYDDPNSHVPQFVSSDGRVLLESQVEILVQAMAGFAPPAAGETSLPQNYQDALAPIIAANWQNG